MSPARTILVTIVDAERLVFEKMQGGQWTHPANEPDSPLFCWIAFFIFGASTARYHVSHLLLFYRCWCDPIQVLTLLHMRAEINFTSSCTDRIYWKYTVHGISQASKFSGIYQISGMLTNFSLSHEIHSKNAMKSERISITPTQKFLVVKAFFGNNRYVKNSNFIFILLM